VVRETGRTRNALIREAVRHWLATTEHSEWPPAVRDFKGYASAVRFEEHRQGLSDPQDPFGASTRRLGRRR
jgi:hypothetical protein